MAESTMTHLQSYKLMADRIFGNGACTFDANSTATNEVIGALASATDYHLFRGNFLARLERLHRAYEGHPKRSALLKQVSEVGSPKNWQGAVAELAAFDLFSSKSRSAPPELDVSIDPSRSLASKLGVKEANLDVHFVKFDAFTDVKVFKDNIAQILNGIYKQVWPKGERPLIRYQFPHDAGHDAVEVNRRQLLTLLQNAVSGGRRPTFVDCSNTVPGLTFRLDWSQGLLVTESSYSPYRHAREAHGLPFGESHVKKFVTDRPFFLTLVVFPWFNNVISSFLNSNMIFYRSFARRVFCQYRYDPVLFSTWLPNYAGGETVFEVSQYLGGLMFLEDHSITGDDPAEMNVSAYFYENPNGRQLDGFF